MTRGHLDSPGVAAGTPPDGGVPAPPDGAPASAGWVERALREHDEQVQGETARFERHGSPQPLPGTVREELVLERIDRARRARPRVKEDRITMSHGAGGKATQTLIEAVFLDTFRNPLLEPLEDAARLHVNGARVALTTDSYVVSPLFFPGGDIGDLAVNGTVNDLSMAGRRSGGRRAGRHRRHQGRAERQGGRLLHQHRRRRGHRAQPGPRSCPGPPR